MTLDKKTYSLQISMILTPFLILVSALLCMQCCGINEYEPDNVVEELTESFLEYQIDKTTGLPIEIDLSPNYGPEKKPLIWTDFEETRR